MVERVAGSAHVLRQYFPDLINIETRPRNDDEINQVQQAAILFPMGQLQESIDSNQEKKAVLLMQRTAHFAHRIDRIKGFVSGGRRFQQGRDKPAIDAARENRHPIAMRERCQVVAVLMGRLPGWNKDDPPQPEHACRRARRPHVPSMNRVEGSAE